MELVRNSAQNFEAREHVQRSIEPSAVGHGIEMPADQQTFLRFAGQRDPIVPGRVVVMLNRKLFHLCGEPFARL